MNFSGLPEQYSLLAKRINYSLDKVLKSGRYIGGAQIQRLEKKLAERTGSQFCISCANGTDALILSLLSHDAKGGDAVFLPAFTFAATAEAVALRGASPVFVDAGDDFMIDPDRLIEAIAAVRGAGKLRPAGIIAVDLFGMLPDYEQLRDIAAREGLWLLEDSAQSFGASWFGKKAGSFGDIAATSFFPSKPLGCYGDGGAVFTDSRFHAERIDSLRLHGRGSSKYEHRLVGMNSRLDTVQAAVLLQKLTLFDAELIKRRKNAALYSAAFAPMGIAPRLREGVGSSWSQYTLRLPDRNTRDGLKLHLSTLGIPSMVYYPAPLHLQQAFSAFGARRGSLPVSEALCDQVLSIPVHAYLTDEDTGLIIDSVCQYLAGRI